MISAERALLLPEAEQLNLTLKLFRDGLFGIKEDPNDFITLKSKRLSPHYLDIRPGISDYNMRQLFARTMVNLARRRVAQRNPDLDINNVYDFFAGTPEAMTSYIASAADLARMRLLQPRVDVDKASGNRTPILGRYRSGETVAAFDDVITDGQSKIDTIRKLGAGGLVVADYFVTLDREEGGVPLVEKETYVSVTPAVAVSGMVRMLRAEGEISLTQFDNVAQYLEEYGDPQTRAVLGIAP